MDSSFDEQEIRDYCQNHTLARPHIHFFHILGVIAIAECFIMTISFLAHRLWHLSVWDCENVLHLLLVFLLGKYISKIVIKLYQHYASEETRRQCHCMPSCSEYALLALDKYWWPKALWLIYRRLTFTCSIPGYKVDYP